MTSNPIQAAEWQRVEAERELWQLTSAPCNNYPLYYFIPTITADGRYLVFHSERTGWVQLFRMDMASGEITQLTDGRTLDSGWATWCVWRLRGIYNHLSCLSQARQEVFYFQDDELRGVHLVSLADRLVTKLPPGRRPIGQTCFSPDGRHFVFIHADSERFMAVHRQGEAAANCGASLEQPAWRMDFGGTTLSRVDCTTGELETLHHYDHHVHHVVYATDNVLVLNHPADHLGLLMFDLTTKEQWIPHSPERSTIGAQAIHQVVTASGIYYEAHVRQPNLPKRIALGRLSDDFRDFEEFLLPGLRGWHVGFDPAGAFTFMDTHLEAEDGTRALVAIAHPRDPQRRRIDVLHRLAALREGGQRHHAHPLLTPDRQWMIFTEDDTDGHSQIFKLRVDDLTDNEQFNW